MATIITRVTGVNAKQAPLTNAEVDQNFININTSLENEITTRTSDVSTLQTNLANETTARQNADAALQNEIDIEETTRANGDVFLQNQLNTEITDRTNADAALDAAKAPKASPVFTGNPTAPTPARFDNTPSLATTAFVNSAGMQTSEVMRVTAATTLNVNDMGKTILLNKTTFGVNALADITSFVTSGAKVGDLCYVRDQEGSNPWYILNAEPPTTLGNWSTTAEPATFNITLPTITPSMAGKAFWFQNVGGKTVGVTASAGNWIFGNGFGSINVGASLSGFSYTNQIGNSAMLVNDGISKWYLVGGSESIRRNANLRSVVVTTGNQFTSLSYQVANDIATQNGGAFLSLTANTTLEHVVTLPIPYDSLSNLPRHCLVNSVGFTDNDPNVTTANVRFLSNSQIAIRVRSTITQNVGLNWLTIGHIQFGTYIY